MFHLYPKDKIKVVKHNKQGDVIKVFFSKGTTFDFDRTLAIIIRDGLRAFVRDNSFMYCTNHSNEQRILTLANKFDSFIEDFTNFSNEEYDEMMNEFKEIFRLLWR